MPLFVVATPIGNLSDLSPRARETLASARLLLCEDTRHTRRLLAALGLPTPTLRTCHARNEAGRVVEVLARLEAGEDVVLVSDAGTPGISDPGGQVVAAALAAGHPVRAIAGPSAVAAALSVSGFAVSPSHILGFPPRSAGDLRRFLIDASRLPGPLVVLESGRRLGRLIAALQEILPDREACICREMTKLHETIHRAPIRELPAENALGELVVVIGPGEPVAEAAPEVSGTGLKAAATLLADRWGCTKREAYQRLLAFERELPPV